jgi:uncharacterized protein (DUF362 family)
MLVFGGAFVTAPLIKACSPAPGLPATAIPRPTTASQLLALSSPIPAYTSTPHQTAGETPAPTAEALSGLEESTQALPLLSKHSDDSFIALVKTRNRSEGVRQALALLGVNPVQGNRVLLKPNFNSADPSPGSTHIDTIRSLVNNLYDMGGSHITVGDRSGMGNTRLVMTQLGIDDLSKELGFDTVVFDDLAASDWVSWNDSDFHWSAGFSVPRLLVESDCVVQTCNLKTHAYGGHFTLSLKNSVGFAAKTIPNSSHDYMRELHNSSYQRQMIAEINMAYKPSLIVLDGVDAFVTGGPAKGKKVESDVILAGTDPVAVDAVGVAILRLFGTTREVSQGTIFDQAQIARAVELGLGVQDPTRIQFITSDPDSEAYAALIQSALNKNS